MHVATKNFVKLFKALSHLMLIFHLPELSQFQQDQSSNACTESTWQTLLNFILKEASFGYFERRFCHSKSAIRYETYFLVSPSAIHEEDTFEMCFPFLSVFGSS